jgi:hypothetical protein
MQTNWPSKHSDALREYVAKGMSYAEIADAINAKFKPAILAMPRSVAPSEWDLPAPTGARSCPSIGPPCRKTRHHG